MKFYRVEFYTTEASSVGIEWFTSKREAEAAASEFIGKHGDAMGIERVVPQAVDIAPTKAGILDALRTYAAHADNG